MESAIEDFTEAVEAGYAVSTFGRTPQVQKVWDGHRHALVIELGARAAYDLIFGYDGPTVARYEVDGRGHLL